MYNKEYIAVDISTLNQHNLLVNQQQNNI